MHATLSAALEAAVREGHLVKNPVKSITRPRRAEFEAKTLTEPQARQLLAVARDSHLGPFIALALTTGMRLGELLALTWDDVDLEAGIVTVTKSVQWGRAGDHRTGPTKTRSGRRRVAIDEPVVERPRRAAVARQRSPAAGWRSVGVPRPRLPGDRRWLSAPGRQFPARIQAAPIRGWLPKHPYP